MCGRCDVRRALAISEFECLAFFGGQHAAQLVRAHRQPADHALPLRRLPTFREALAMLVRDDKKSLEEFRFVRPSTNVQEINYLNNDIRV